SYYSKCLNNISLEFARIVTQDLVQVEINNKSFEFKRQKTNYPYAFSSSISSYKQTLLN
ncbi:5507_t:CDS:1, partial [Funneliformis geosporum]